LKYEPTGHPQIILEMNLKNNKYTEFITISLIVLLYFLISEIFLNKSFIYDDFAINWLIESGKPDILIFPHHLIFGSVIYSIYVSLKQLFPHLKPLAIIQQINLIAGTLSIIFLYKIIKLLTDSLFKIVTAILSVIFTFVWWRYSQGLEAYIISYLLIFISYAIFLKQVKTGEYKIKSIIFSGVIWTIAILLHQIHIMMVVPLFILFLIAIKKELKNAKYYILLFSITSLLVILSYAGTYLYLKTYYIPDSPDIFHWMTYYAHRNVWGNLTISTPVRGISGFLRAFSLMSPLRNWSITGVFNYKVLLSIIGNGLLFFLLFYLVINAIINIKRIFKNPLLVFIFIWFILYSVFNLWWEPEYYKFWVLVIPPLLILLFYLLDFEKTRNRIIVLLFITILFSLNFIYEFLPKSNLNSIPEFQMCEILNNTKTNEEDIIYCREYINGYYKYYFDKKIINQSLIILKYHNKPEENDIYIEKIRNDIDNKLLNGNRVLFSESMYYLDIPVLDIFPVKDKNLIDRFMKPYNDNLKPIGAYKNLGKKMKIFELKVNKNP
jgi:hypothetical protein